MKRAYSATPEEIQALQDSAISFGKTMIAWRVRNNWTQYTIDAWSKQTGFSFTSYASLSTLENGKVLHPRPFMFIQLGALNQRIATLSKESLIQIHDIKLRKIIQNSKPIESFVHGIWDAQHFFMHFIGSIEAPKELFVPRTIPPIAESKEQAFMMLSSKRFQVVEDEIRCPKEMTAKERKLVDFLCNEHKYFSVTKD